MNPLKPNLIPVLAGLAVLLAGPAAIPTRAHEPAAATTNTPPAHMTGTNTVAAATPAKPAPHEITGAELYSIHCNRCHQERYPTERTAAQWKTIMLHMQVRANLPASQSRLILKYLQENSGR